jgi:hypothetical protein
MSVFPLTFFVEEGSDLFERRLVTENECGLCLSLENQRLSYE